MRRFGYGLALLLLTAPLLASGHAAAADATAEQAQALTAQLQAWLHGLLGPSATVVDVHTTAEGDHFHLTLPITKLDGPDRDITATLRPLDAGRWAAEDIRLPTAGSFTAKIPRPNCDAGPPPASGISPQGLREMRVQFAIAEQHTHGELDPTMATPSNLSGELRGIAIDSQSEGDRQTQRLDRYSVTLGLKPADANRIDIDSDSAIDGWRAEQHVASGQPLTISAKHLSGAAQLRGLDRAHAATFQAALVSLAEAPTPERNERLRALVVTLRGLLASAHLEETIEGMQVAAGNQGTAAIDRVHLAWDSAAPEGDLSTGLQMGLDGLSIADMPPTAAALAPKHVTLGVSLSGLSTDALSNLALAALAPGANGGSLAPQIDALFSAPGKEGAPQLGIDTLSFDAGPARFDGHGSVIATSPNDVRGTARVTVTGFDALADRVRDDPHLQQALPFMIIARGLARSDGSALVWDIVLTPDGLTVNGFDPRDLSQPKRGSKPPRPSRSP